MREEGVEVGVGPGMMRRGEPIDPLRVRAVDRNDLDVVGIAAAARACVSLMLPAPRMPTFTVTTEF